MSLVWTLKIHSGPIKAQIHRKLKFFRSEVEVFVNPKSTIFVVISGQKHFLSLKKALTGKVKNHHFSWVRTLKVNIRDFGISISHRFFASVN